MSSDSKEFQRADQLLDETKNLVETKVGGSESDENRVLAGAIKNIIGIVKNLQGSADANSHNVILVRDAVTGLSRNTATMMDKVIQALEILNSQIELLQGSAEESKKFKQEFSTTFDKLKQIITENKERAKRGEESGIYD